MADVQLEHGHVRIANRLAEALLDAEFTGVQFKILHALIRLTYGWRRRTVTLSHAELAGYMHASASGTFRAALRELVAEGVVVQAEKGGGGKRSTYAIEKDFTKWGRFEVGASRLARIYGERPESDDDALFQANLAIGGAPETGTPTEPPCPIRAEAPARIRRELAPESGTGTGAKSNNGETVAPRKDRERQGKTVDVVVDDGGAVDPMPSLPEYALQLTVTANQSITEKWGEQPAVFLHGASHQLAADLRDRGVPLDIARASIRSQLVRRRLEDGPPGSIRWFEKGIDQAWTQEQQRRIDAATVLPVPAALAPTGTDGRAPTIARMGVGGRAYLTTLDALKDIP